MSEHIMLLRGDIQNHTILIEDDNECEISPNELFWTILVSSGIWYTSYLISALLCLKPISVDNDEFECGKWIVWYIMDSLLLY